MKKYSTQSHFCPKKRGIEQIIFFLLFALLTHDVSAQWTQLGTDIDGDQAEGHFGESVALSADGRYMAIGSAEDDNNGNDNAGVVRVYQWNAGTSSWDQLGADIEGDAALIESGISVDLSDDGSRLAVGAYLDSGGGTLRGSVKIYEWNAGTSSWDQLGANINGTNDNDESGRRVVLSSDGSTIAIGSHGFDDAGDMDVGQVRVYDYDAMSTMWNLRGNAIVGDNAQDELGGYGLSLSGDGNRLAAGAWGDDTNGANAGLVRIYNWNAGTSLWEQVGGDLYGSAAGDEFGRAVSLSSDGTTLAIGAKLNDDSTTAAGHVRVYRTSDGTTWQQIGSTITGNEALTYLGSTVSLTADGSYLAVGVPGSDSPATNAGHVMIYNWNSTTMAWDTVGTQGIEGEAFEDEAGSETGLALIQSGDSLMVAIGAKLNDDDGNLPINAGHTRVFFFDLTDPMNPPADPMDPPADPMDPPADPTSEEETVELPLMPIWQLFLAGLILIAIIARFLPTFKHSESTQH